MSVNVGDDMSNLERNSLVGVAAIRTAFSL